MGQDQIPLTVSEALSGIFGSISLASWIFLLVPQLVENYRARSASGISITFLLIWFLGDLTNLIGAVWAGLVPTVIALAAYFCISDTALLLQCLYYNLWVNGGQPARKSSTASDTVPDPSARDTDPREDEPLLSRTDSNNSYASNTGLPGSHKRRRSTLTKITERPDSLDPAAPPQPHKARALLLASLKNTGFVLAVCAIGTAGWALAYKLDIWMPQPLPETDRAQHGADSSTPLGATILGYASAVAYLGARIPQIYKNWAAKSCEGLALLFFLLSLLGNATYGLGILCHSLDREYVLTNLPWLIGSLGTMAEDVTIFVQFHVYGDKSEGEDAG